MRKGISPLIASVLLVAFTMAVAAILVVWITGFTQQQTTTVGARGEKQTSCSFSTISINKDDVTALGSKLNITVTYSSGTEKLNITGFALRDANSVTYYNTTVASDTTSLNMNVGENRKFINYALNSPITPAGTAWAEVRVTALCQDQVAIVGTAKA
ncbi:MAG: archaellin/type IV pilin N-terminal domain-containing protein [Candidatus Aenigmatarchaeota archaeon]